MGSDNVLVDRDGDRVRVTLDRPEKSNALTGEMFLALGKFFEEFADEAVDIVTVRGSGGDFSAGVDMSDVPEWGQMNPLDVRAVLEPVHDALRAIEELDAPVVAALDGYVLGGGLELALACDLRVASETAEFGLPESKMGLAMDLGGAQKLPGMIGEGMTGETIDARRAHEVGLVEEWHPKGAFEDAVADLEATLAEKPTYVHGFAKRQVHAARPLNLEEVMQQAIHHAIAAYNEPETQRCVREFLED